MLGEIEEGEGEGGNGVEVVEVVVVVCWLLSVPTACWCISGMDLLRQFYVLSH